MAFEEQLFNLVFVALGALAGSAFMWLVLGPIVIRRAAPRLVRSVIAEVAGLTEDEIAESKGDFFKAMTKKQGETFAQAIYGAMGKVIQTAPDSELEKLAKQYGFEGVEDAAKKLGGQGLGPMGGGGNLGGLQTALAGLGGAKGGGFTRIVELISALSAFQQLGANGGMPAMSGMGGTGSFNPGLHRR